MNQATATAPQDTRQSPVFPAFRRFFHWWGEQLLALLPQGLRQRLGRDRQRQRLCVEPDGIRLYVQADGAPRLATAAEGPPAELIPDLPLAPGTELGLLLSPRLVLSSRVSLPLAAEENLRQVVGYELDRLTPFRADQVHYAAAVRTRHPDRQAMEVELVVIGRERLDDILQALRQRGVNPTSVGVLATAGGEPGQVMDGIDLLPRAGGEGAGSHSRRTLFWTATCLLLIAANLFLPLLRQQWQIDRLQQALAVQRPRIDQILHLRDDLDRRVRRFQEIAGILQRRPPLTRVVAELSRLLPDGTWVERLDIRGQDLSLMGQSDHAADLIALIESSPLFHDTRFVSPVTQAIGSPMASFRLRTRLATGDKP